MFGENRVQEAQGKWPALREKAGGLGLHLIGPLQSNKAEDAVALFDVIETVDRPKIAEALAKAMDKLGKRPKLFVQVNTGAEPQKTGVLPPEADAFLQSCRGPYGLEIAGLMCIPPRRRSGVAAFRAPEHDRRPQRPSVAVHGHERRFRTRDPARRDPCACRQRHFRGAIGCRCEAPGVFGSSHGIVDTFPMQRYRFPSGKIRTISCRAGFGRNRFFKRKISSGGRPARRCPVSRSPPVLTAGAVVLSPRDH